jgi:hypothetical protein
MSFARSGRKAEAATVTSRSKSRRISPPTRRARSPKHTASRRPSHATTC